MTSPFSQIPQPVVGFVRSVFASANDKVSRTLCTQPSAHEEMLDFILVTELSASPSAYFAQERMAVSLQSHWLGSRAMWGRWEVADIAFFVTLRTRGHLTAQKVALLQTKRLYTREIAVDVADEFDRQIGMGRIVDTGETIVSHPSQRKFRFDEDCKYEALSAGHRQVEHIDAYMARMKIPVYYGLYNPLSVPFEAMYPASNGDPIIGTNDFGMRVLSATTVHAALAPTPAGTSPALKDLRSTPLDAVTDPQSSYGWRLEKFIADEVLACRQGILFDPKDDERLRSLLYARSGPIAAAINITIDALGE